MLCYVILGFRCIAISVSRALLDVFMSFVSYLSRICDMFMAYLCLMTYLWHVCVLWQIYDMFMTHLWHFYDICDIFMTYLCLMTFVTCLWHICVLWHVYGIFVTHLWHICVLWHLWHVYDIFVLWHICDMFMTCRGVTLTPHPLLVLWSRKSRAIPLLPLWAVRPVQSLSACTRVHFTFMAYLWHDFYGVFVVCVTFCYLCFVVPSNFRSCKWSLSVMLSSQTAAVRVFQTRPSLRHCLGDRKFSFVSCVFGWRQRSNWLTTQHTSRCSKHSCKLQLTFPWECY